MATSSAGPSPHLTWRELACKDGTSYPERWRESRARSLAIEFERLRARVGVPLVVVSAYRTPAHNRAGGGARRSQHLEGRALDLKPTAGVTVAALHAAALAQAREADSRIRGVGRYRSFIHIDIRPGERLVRWAGQGVKDDTP